jgi:hypothetical protein
MACGHGRNGQRRGIGGDARSDAHPEVDRSHLAPHGPPGALDRRGTGPAGRTRR